MKYSQLAIKIPEQCYNCSSDITANFEHVIQIRPVSLLLYCFIADFEQVAVEYLVGIL